MEIKNQTASDNSAKFSRFQSAVLKTAMDQKEAILMDARDEKRRVLDQKETELLQAAYDAIQFGVQESHRKMNEIISRASMEGKKQLLSVRTSLFHDILQDVGKKLHDFCESDEYRGYLWSQLEDTVDSLGPRSEIRAFVCKRDERFASALQQELGVRVEATLPDSYIGGCVLVHDRRRIHMDMTLREKLESSKEHLFEISGLEIEAHDIKKKG